MIAAPHSGSGKTVLTCGLLRSLLRRGIRADAYKCGPDYIDPMFHRRVLGVPSRNLDLFLQGEEGVRRTLAGQRGEFALLEGAMGFYDGVNGTDAASAWQVAEVTNTPVVLALRPRGTSLTLAAQVKGLMDFRPNSHLAALVLVDCKAMLFAHLKPLLERETGLPVLGYLPPMEQARLESRHLGLLTAGEIADLAGRFDAVAEQLERTVDLDALFALGTAAELPLPHSELCQPKRARIAVARDEAFCFYYPDNLDALARAGAELCFFSPLTDDALPDCDGLYLGGGYPELYAGALADNRRLRADLAERVRGGLPTLAECGGFLYLQQSLEDGEGAPHPMAGVLPGRGIRTGQLRRFGYLWLCPEGESMLFRPGERVPAHEFHYWDCTENGSDLAAEKPSGRAWRCGYAGPRLYAAFPHLHFGGELPLARRFVDCAETYHKERNP